MSSIKMQLNSAAASELAKPRLRRFSFGSLPSMHSSAAPFTKPRLRRFSFGSLPSMHSSARAIRKAAPSALFLWLSTFNAQFSPRHSQSRAFGAFPLLRS